MAKLLGEHEINRTAYPTLDVFFPRIVTFLNDFSGRVQHEIKDLSEQQRTMPGGCSAVYASSKNSGRYLAKPETSFILDSSRTSTMNTSSGSSHSLRIPKPLAERNPKRG